MGYGRGATVTFFSSDGPELKAIFLPLLFLFRKANTLSNLPKTQTCPRVFPFDCKSPDLEDRLIHSLAHLCGGLRTPAALRSWGAYAGLPQSPARMAFLGAHYWEQGQWATDQAEKG